jgi:hypothetical protein
MVRGIFQYPISSAILTSMSTPAHGIKQAAHQLIDQLPENSTWDDVLYRLAVRRSIEIGLRESEAGNGVNTETARAEFGLNKQSPQRK